MTISQRCEDCDKEFRYVKEFHVHQMVNHKEKFEQQTDKELLSNFEPTVYYKCKKCDKTFRWLSVLKRHTETHQKTDAHTDDQPENDGQPLIGNQTVTDIQLKSENDAQEEEEEEIVQEIDVAMEGTENESAIVEIQEKSENGCEAMEVMENEVNAIRVYVAQGGQITNENGEEVNILACGHCMAGFTDESELNAHVITEHADLIAQVGVTTVQVVENSENTVDDIQEMNENIVTVVQANEGSEDTVVDEQVDVKVEVVTEEDMLLAHVIQQSQAADYT